jgi:hypothetical protein
MRNARRMAQLLDVAVSSPAQLELGGG